MVTRVNSSLPAVIIQTRSYATPIIAALALAAIGYLLIQVAKSLIGRVQPMISAESLYAQGCNDYGAGKYAEAIQKFILALQRMPDRQLRVKIFADLGAAYAANDKLKEAPEDFESAIDSYLDQATIFADQNDHAQAILVYTEALKRPFTDDDHALIFCRRAASYYVLENYALSLSDFNAGFALNPQDQYLRAEILTHRSEINIKMNQTETVLKDLADALACSFDNPKLRRYIYSARGDFCAKTGDHAQAADDYNMALYCQPYKEDVFAQIVYKRGCSYSALEQWDDALRDFTDAFASNFSDDQLRARILGDRAVIYITREQFQLAANDLTAAIGFNPSEDLDQMLTMRALVFMKLNQYPEAIVDFTEAIEMNPNDEDCRADLLHQRGRAHRENQSPDLARQDFEAALRCNFTKEGLREEILAELNPKTEQPAGIISTIWGKATSKWNGWSKK